MVLHTLLRLVVGYFNHKKQPPLQEGSHRTERPSLPPFGIRHVPLRHVTITLEPGIHEFRPGVCKDQILDLFLCAVKNLGAENLGYAEVGKRLVFTKRSHLYDGL